MKTKVIQSLVKKFFDEYAETYLEEDTFLEFNIEDLKQDFEELHDRGLNNILKAVTNEINNNWYEHICELEDHEMEQATLYGFRG
jgi:hypothetical protein